MRLLPGQPADLNQEDISSYNLMNRMVNEPDMIPTVFRKYGKHATPFTSFLAATGMQTKGLFDGLSTKNYRVVKSNHVMYAIKNDDRR